MLYGTPFLKIKGPDSSGDDIKSAIVNCICPECGAALSLNAQQFRCQGRCGRDWRPTWIRMQQSGRVLNFKGAAYQ